MLDSVFAQFASPLLYPLNYIFCSTRNYFIIIWNLQGSALAVDLALGGVLVVRSQFLS